MLLKKALLKVMIQRIGKKSTNKKIQHEHKFNYRKSNQYYLPEEPQEDAEKIIKDRAYFKIKRKVFFLNRFKRVNTWIRYYLFLSFLYIFLWFLLLNFLHIHPVYIDHNNNHSDIINNPNRIFFVINQHMSCFN